MNYEFLFGYEESIGYLIGTHARDKDAVVSAMIVCEMAAEYKNNNINFIQKLDEIYREFGYFKDCQDSYYFEGIDGKEKINSIMEKFRTDDAIFDDIVKVIDYKKDVYDEIGLELLPKSNVLKFILSDGTWVAVRPSGTEPKLKIYYSIKQPTSEFLEKRLNELKLQIKNKVGLYK